MFVGHSLALTTFSLISIAYVLVFQGTIKTIEVGYCDLQHGHQRSKNFVGQCSVLLVD